MSLVVADSSPIRYLVILNAVDLLRQLYGHVILPQSVLAELKHPHGPAEVRTWASALPNWVELKKAAQVELANVLDAGEAEAIALAKELKGDLVLLDEREARREAARCGLMMAGTVAVLEEAAARNLIDLGKAFQKLLTTNFRIDRRYLEDALRRDVQRKEREHTRDRGMSR